MESVVLTMPKDLYFYSVVFWRKTKTLCNMLYYLTYVLNAILHVRLVYSSLYVPQHHTSKYQYSRRGITYVYRTYNKYNILAYKHKYTHIWNFLYPHSSKLNSIVFLFCRNSNTNKREMTTWTTKAIRRNNTMQ